MSIFAPRRYFQLILPSVIVCIPFKKCTETMTIITIYSATHLLIISSHSDE